MEAAKNWLSLPQIPLSFQGHRGHILYSKGLTKSSSVSPNHAIRMTFPNEREMYPYKWPVLFKAAP